MELTPEPYNHINAELNILEEYGSYENAVQAMNARHQNHRPDEFEFSPILSDDAESLNPERPAPVTWEEYEPWVMAEWRRLLDSSPAELEVQRFLEQHPSLLPGAGDDVGRGHHGSCWGAVITQPSLKGVSHERVPDFMWVRSDTATVYALCIEIEAPSKPWFTLDGQSTAYLTQALDQILEWKVWFSIPENMLAFRHAYIPVDLGYHRIEMQFILIYGRDAEFRAGESRHRDPGFLRRKRDLIPRASEYLYTFDQLRPERDAANSITITGRRGEFKVVAVPPTLTTGSSTENVAAEIADISAVLNATPLMSDERKFYLAERWNYWRRSAEPRMNRGGFTSHGDFFGE
ncbi:Shedu anti-phage system protein SduA domain-containing protein [Streptomyces sp. f51]|uniref:Shedu anti-phage system protein SduA domain-containing protein n=1 Tax=Streptomyces sp. f51 TaxID=1827742 RepID=UPI0030CE0A44